MNEVKIGATYRHIDHTSIYKNARREVLDIAEDLSTVKYLYWEEPYRYLARTLYAPMHEFILNIEEVKP